MPAPCTMVFGFCWMKSGVAAIVLPIVIMDHPMTILAVWPAWSAPRYMSRNSIDGVELVANGSHPAPGSPVDLHTGVSRVGERLAAVGNALRGANAAAPVRRVRVRMAFEHHALAKL